MSHSQEQVILALSMGWVGELHIRLMLVRHMHLFGIGNCKGVL